MANKKTKLGKVVGTVNGYTVRHMVETRQTTVTDRFGRKKATGTPRVCATGKFGIYAGKNLCREGFATKDAALEFAAEY